MRPSDFDVRSVIGVVWAVMSRPAYPLSTPTCRLLLGRLPLGWAVLTWGVLSMCTAHLRAQSTVVPAAARTVEGNSLDRLPFGRDRARHAQYIDGRALVGVRRGVALRAISYRRDTQLSNTNFVRSTRAGKRMPSWTMRVANFTGNWQSPPASFNSTSAARWTIVINRRTIDFPDLARPSSGVAPFAIRMVLDQPFTFQGPGLAVQHSVHESSNLAYTYYADAVQRQQSTGTVTTLAGSRECPVGGNRLNGSVGSPGGNLDLRLFSGPQSAVALLGIGASKSQWGSLSLPFPLASIGLPGCSIAASFDAVVATRTNATGIGGLSLPIPDSPATAGAVLYAQWAVRDPRVNPAVGLALSNAVEIKVGTEPFGAMPMSVTFYEGSGTTSVGFKSIGRGMVLQVEQ